MTSVFGVCRADFLERSRRFSFIAMMAAALFAAFWFVPKDDGSMQVMLIQPDRFIQAGNPTWIPIASAWGLGFFLPLIGFFYLKNALTFDEKSGVSQLISASPAGNLRYMLGKFCSGTLLLYCFTAVVMAGSFFMSVWHFPNQLLSAYEFFSPFAFLLFALPFCAALAVFFESVRFLRGAIGSTVYIIAFITMYVIVGDAETPSLLMRSFDFSGTAVILHGIGDAVLEQSGEPMDILLFMGGIDRTEVPPTAQLVFDGVRLTAADIQGFAGMIVVMLGLTALSAPLYSFSQKIATIKLPKMRRSDRKTAVMDYKQTPEYTPIRQSSGYNVFRGLFAELRLMLSGQPLLWKAVSVLGVVLCVFIDLGTAQTFVMPLFMLWFVNVFSAMGSREYQFDMLKIISTAPNGRFRQITISWLSGICIAITISVPVILRMSLAGQIDGVFACLAGAIFVPSLAAFLGEFTKTRRAFELSFIFVTYIILNNAPAFMYMGINPSVVSLSRAGAYLAAGIVLGVAAVVKRSRLADFY